MKLYRFTGFPPGWENVITHEPIGDRTCDGYTAPYLTGLALAETILAKCGYISVRAERERRIYWLGKDSRGCDIGGWITIKKGD